MSEKQDTKRSGRAQRFTVTGKYSNARSIAEGGLNIEDGDAVMVLVGAPFKDGDLVLFTCDCRYFETTHYHALYYGVCRGKKYKFILRTWPQEQGGTRHKADELQRIVGPVVKVINKGKSATAAAPKQDETTATRISGFDWPLYGIHVDDRITIAYNHPLKPGQMVLIGQDSPKWTGLWVRLCSIRDGVARVTGDVGSDESDWADIPIEHIAAVATSVDHSRCVRSKVEALRARLSQIDADNITDSTARYKLEKEIYDLEHPIETGYEDEDFDLPDEIEG